MFFKYAIIQSSIGSILFPILLRIVYYYCTFTTVLYKSTLL